MTHRILVLHSRYRSGDLSGENRVVEDDVRLLREAGHEVAVWAPTPPDARGLPLARMGGGAVWSSGAARRVRRLVRETGARIVHLHNLFPMLSPAAIRAAAAAGAATVVTLHNSRLLCLPGTLLRDGLPCRLCVGRVPIPGVRYACYRGSRPASGALAASLTLHRGIGTFAGVGGYLAVSDFIRRTHVEGGLPGERIRVRSNFSWPAAPREGPGEHFLYVGRLSPEKGIEWLARAWRREWGRLLVVGDGPSLGRLRGEAAEGVDLLGPRSPSEVSAEMRRARALVVPSTALEAQARVILEAAAVGVPVVASRTGGLPEAVEDGVSGLLPPPTDVPGWTAAIGRLLDDEASVRLGRGALRVWEERFTPTIALGALEEVYRQVLD